MNHHTSTQETENNGIFHEIETWFADAKESRDKKFAITVNGPTSTNYVWLTENELDQMIINLIELKVKGGDYGE